MFHGQLADHPLKAGDLILVGLQTIIVFELRLKLATFMLQHPNPDPIASDVVLSREAIQALPGQELLGDLALKPNVK